MCTFPATTSSKHASFHAASSNPRTSRPKFFASAGVRAARICASASLSPNSEALPAIMKFSADAYTTPSTVNEHGHHWLSEPFPTVPSASG